MILVHLSSVVSGEHLGEAGAVSLDSASLIILVSEDIFRVMLLVGDMLRESSVIVIGIQIGMLFNLVAMISRGSMHVGSVVLGNVMAISVSIIEKCVDCHSVGGDSITGSLRAKAKHSCGNNSGREVHSLTCFI